MKESEKRKIEYYNYIDSSAWRRKRKQALSEHGHSCRRCRSTANLRVHHLTYERFGDELLSDLMILCEGCHDAFHRMHGMPTGDELRSKTIAFCKTLLSNPKKKSRSKSKKKKESTQLKVDPLQINATSVQERLKRQENLVIIRNKAEKTRREVARKRLQHAQGWRAK